MYLKGDLTAEPEVGVMNLIDGPLEMPRVTNLFVGGSAASFSVIRGAADNVPE